MEIFRMPEQCRSFWKIYNVYLGSSWKQEKIFDVVHSQIYHGWWLQVKLLDMSYIGSLKLKQYTSGHSQT